jgi:hypothetical protein
MSFASHTPADSPLSSSLEQIAEIHQQIGVLEIEIKELKKKRDALEAVAVEELLAGRLDSVRVAGKSWRVEWVHSVNATGEQQDAILAAARTAGMDQQLVGVNTTRLKAVLKEMAKAAGKDVRTPWADGTPFAGLVSEYVRPELRHLTNPSS